MVSNDVRRPNVLVTANGVAINNTLSVEVESNSFLGADRFRVSAAFDVAEYSVWASNAVDIVVAASLDGDWQELIRGSVDRIELDVGAGLIHADGRDLTARFMEARTQETFENQTASDIAQLLALRRGLVPNVSPTTTFIGRDYGGDHSQVTLDRYSTLTTEWDLLAKLAINEGFDVWVDGQTLNFMAPTAGYAPLTVRPYDCQSLRLDRALALSSGLEVIVKSWDCRAQAAVIQAASMGVGSYTQSYVLMKPNLTEYEAAELAQRALAEIAQNARIITLEWPGELLVKPRQSLSLLGSGTDFDGLYTVTSVERHISFEHGFTETIQARTPPWTAS